jgi:electron transfer flavoprotein alpha subunit
VAEILVVAEHRQNQLRDITLQMVGKAAELALANACEASVVLLGDDVGDLVEPLKNIADRVIVYSDPVLEHFAPRLYAEILASLIAERTPLLTLLGHTPWSMDLAPALAVKTGYPLATDCVDILLDGGRPKVIRQIYGGKVFARMAFREAPGYLATVRAGAFAAATPGDRHAEVIDHPVPATTTGNDRESSAVEDTARGEVDIVSADLLVSVGRGIGEQENIDRARELATLLGGALSCSRPVVDKKWLPKYHQVGTSGKSVKPKIYLALGISGAFQHVAGISGAETIIAVNKDKKAPIFRVADYGATADVLDVIAALKTRLGKTS